MPKGPAGSGQELSDLHINNIPKRADARHRLPFPSSGDARIDAAAAATTWILLDTDYHPKTQDTVLFLRTTAGIKSIKLSCPLTVNHLHFFSRSDPECQMLPNEVVFFQFSSARQKK